MIELRHHQAEFVHDVLAAFRGSQSVLGVAAPGFGKTVVAAYLMQRARGPVVFACHRDSLIRQTSSTLSRAGIAHTNFANGYDYDPSSRLCVASIWTLSAREQRPPAGLLIVDEAHLSASDTWASVIQGYIGQGARVLGLTGSPWRLDGRPLGDLFDAMVCGPSTAWLIDEGYLASYRLYAPVVPDMRGVARSGGDWARSGAADAMGQPYILSGAVKHWLDKADGMRTIGYACNVAHAQQMASQFNSAGIPSAAIWADVPREEQSHLAGMLARGDLRVLWNVELATAGFDLEALSGLDAPLQCGIFARPTQSLALWLQMSMRPLRKQPGEAMLLDLAGNALRHGLPCDDRDMSLTAPARKPRSDEEGGVESIRQCGRCYAIYEPQPTCPYCGAESKKSPMELREIEGRLREMERNASRSKHLAQGKAKTVPELIAMGKSRREAFAIVKAREAKARLIDDVMRANPSEARENLEKMKPADLRKML